MHLCLALHLVISYHTKTLETMATAFPPDRSYGCTHYKRKCKFLTTCCKKVYTCRFCHDEKENHILNRKGVKTLICGICEKKQPVGTNCTMCEVRFGEYICLVCNLFDDEDKMQFHCIECGICRVGGSDNYFHCKTCNMCLCLRLVGAHKCVENRSHAECPVCLEDMHTSRNELFVSQCGHLLHDTCNEQLKKAGYHVCPICKESLKNTL